MTINRLTERDREIVKHMEKYKYATISQLERIFFREQRYSYNIARKRMLVLKYLDFVKVHKDLAYNRNIYIYSEEKWKVPSYHRLLILDVLAEMKYNGFDVEVFDIEKHWCDGKFISDAFAIFNINDRRYHMFIEVQTSNNYHNLEKYDKLYETGAVQQYYGKDFFPKRILFITDREFKNINLKHCQVIQIDTKLKGFATILL